MILSNLRASAWKYAALLLLALFITALIAASFFWARSAVRSAERDAATARAEAAETRVRTLEDAAKRDAQSDTATSQALSAMDTLASVTFDRLARMEGRIHDRPPVPAVCPGPDPVIYTELQDGGARFRGTEGRLRSLRNAEGAGAESAPTH